MELIWGILLGVGLLVGGFLVIATLFPLIDWLMAPVEPWLERYWDWWERVLKRRKP